MDNNSSIPKGGEKDGEKKPPNYFRNKVDLTSLEGIEVEAGSLWKLEPHSSLLILVDEDQYTSYELDENLFEPVSSPTG